MRLHPLGVRGLATSAKRLKSMIDDLPTRLAIDDPWPNPQ